MTMDVNSADKWERDYQRGGDGWDLGGPNPVFHNLLANGQITPGKMIVLCSGRGHDAREFARHGFQVTAVDFSQTAVEEMKRLTDPDASLEILQYDLFALPDHFDNSFDYMLEYTCYCAIDPRRRGEFADLAARVLKPGGLYISLAYPISQHAGGPPFAISVPEMLGLFQERGFKLAEQKTPSDSVPSRRGTEKLIFLQKESQA